ncbi:molybdenum cofactor guanylyltransferase [Acidobacteria bacterium ACD]|nr:MAG: molybdenum cofactor guanylyltransferase [Acidobacteriota bacterium]MCE7959148.1 molybdenum cofactor guanylyltransferase [Acidobacteria bacterium ACB2]MDL1949521.1 molybdenum cofactor guanylyltransferase [Acidobacteria bacterium ACD]
MAFGFVLVGGRSERMGRDKALLPYRGRTMALHQVEKAAFVCGRAALVGKDPEPFRGSGYLFVRDEAEPHAAIYGVLAALAYSPEDVNLVLAADMPRVSEAFLASLLEVAEVFAAPVVAPVSGGSVQTLCSVWRRSALLPLTGRVLRGSLALVEAIAELGGVLIPEEETAAMPGGEPEAFANVNRPEDYAALTKDS